MLTYSPKKDYICKNLQKMMNLIGLGGQEIIIVALVILVLFGGKKIPELMRGLGQGIKEFNKAKANIETEVNESIKELEEK